MTHPTEPRDLLCCPFCGGEAKHESTRFGYPPQHWVTCEYCRATTTAYSNRGAAADAWNHRTAAEAANRERVAELEAECFRLAAGACINPGQHGLVGDEGGNSVCTAHEALLAEEKAHSEALADLAANRDEVERLRAGVGKFLEMLEHGYTPFVEDRLSEAMCCSGHMCGCRGASVGEYLAHLLREDTGLARAALSPTATEEAGNG